MKTFTASLLAAACLTILPALAQDVSFSAADILKLPKDRYFGEVAGVATNSKGNIFVYQRSGNPTASLGGSRTFAHGGSELLEFDPSGKFVREIGKGLYGMLVANSVRVDRDDNIWIVDRFSGMVIKFSPDGSKLLLLLGRKPESIDVPQPPPRAPRAGGPAGAGTSQDLFTGPTDVAWDGAGNIFISEGYGGNTRIAKFTPDGVFMKTWGATGTDNNSFASPRSLAVDAGGNVYVADTGNHRIQVFDNNGAYKSSITGIGDPWAICISKGAHPTLYSSASNPVNDLDSGGEIYKLDLNGSIAGKFGHAGKRPNEFGTVNQIDCRGANTLFTAELGNYRVQKVTLR